MPRPRPLLVLIAASSGLFLCGCDAPAVTKPGIVTPDQSRAAQIATPVPALAAAKSFGLAWESYLTCEGEITGIESSTNLVTWKLEAEWPILTESNVWRDTNPAPMKFYRAFNRAP